MRVSIRGKFSRSSDLLDADLDGKVCVGCQAYKSWEQFIVTGRGRCKSCVATKNAEDHPLVWRIRDAKRRAKAAGLPFDLEEKRDEAFCRIVNGCEMTGLPFDLSVKGKGNRNAYSLSIDRIEADKGYVLSNCRFILWGLNVAFNNWGEAEFEAIARAWLERKSLPC